MNQLQSTANRISSSLFSFHVNSKRFIGEASTIGLDHNPMGEVWPNSQAKGFVLVSERTGVEALWIYSHERLVGEDGLIWVFRPSPSTLDKNPGLRGASLEICND
jgi:hypothetical protein